ncbi:MAG: hypothetical protein IPJ19_16285 [Planctomycetes bacterium]|nr:hypothetical protein [Planctomycetota bacterium]
MILRATALGLFVFTPSPLWAQVAATASTPAVQALGELGYTSDGEDVAPPMVIMQGEVAGQPAGAAKKLSPRAEKLKKLEYDRRPSTSLKAWANPPKPKEAEQAAEAKPAEAAPSAPAEPVAPEKALTPEELAKKAEAEAAAKKAAEEAAKNAAEAKAIDAEMAALQRNVTLGEWAAVKEYFAKLTEDEQKAGYDQLLASLVRGQMQPPPNVQQQGQLYIEKNRFALADVLGLLAADPLPLGKEQLAKLGQILRQGIDAGLQLDTLVDALRPGLDAKDSAVDRRKLALLLAGANQLVELNEFLPTIEEAEKQNDREGLNLIARSCLANNAKDNKAEWLEKAWNATQAALASGEVKEEEKNEALARAVDIAPRIQKELGAAWLEESFTKRPERGMEILAAIGSSAAISLQSQPTQSELRLNWLKLQQSAAQALIAGAPELAQKWTVQLSLLANNWLRDALVSWQFDKSTSRAPAMQRDTYGNFYYYDWQEQQMRGMQPAPIKTGEMLDIRPDEKWLALIGEGQRPRFEQAIAQLFLKVSEEAEAFPYIEDLARTHPKPAKELVDEFLRVWAKNHDPNSSTQRRNPYIFMYGFEERANGIPLTRSKQERNLSELADWVARLRKLPVELDEQLIVNAFTAAHSSAEVYRIETIERIFGSLKNIDPATLAGLVQQMRTNLVSIWRDPAAQKNAKTNRGQQDIQAEVLRGYELAHKTVDRALADHPQSWELVLADAALKHDENNYIFELKKDPEFATRRREALDLFAKAAQLYVAASPAIPKEKETTQVFETWFYATLGASDLNKIGAEQVLAQEEIPKIRAALLSFPPDSGGRYMDLFTSGLFTRMSSAAPAIKFRYVREGLAIVGDNKLAHEARQIFDYYNDLVTEIKLEAVVDGDDRVGHGVPFGLQVNIRHTREIERESGGFAKYLQNQNSVQFAYNYGRPLEDYRDKFEEAARNALKQDFDVLSVTFNEPEVKSRATPEYGWRITPYAYILLQPRGPQVDRIPPLRLDLDFLDTSGYAVLPIESPVRPIDASPDQGDARPFEKLHLTQTLDERQAKDGKLLLELKATSTGLVPPLDALADVAPGEFDVAKTDDHGLSVVKFDNEGEGTGILSERTWTLTLRAREGLEHLPTSFHFAKPKLELAGLEHFRYEDADLVSVPETVELERNYGSVRRPWIGWVLGGLALAAAGWFLLRRTVKSAQVDQARFRSPETITPFTVLGLLRDIERNNGLAAQEKQDLRQEIVRIEAHYFGEPQAAQPDLGQIAQVWVARVS